MERPRPLCSITNRRILGGLVIQRCAASSLLRHDADALRTRNGNLRRHLKLPFRNDPEVRRKDKDGPGSPLPSFTAMSIRYLAAPPVLFSAGRLIGRLLMDA